jgi:hypothetical protein
LLKIGFFRQVTELRIQRKNPGTALRGSEDFQKTEIGGSLISTKFERPNPEVLNKIKEPSCKPSFLGQGCRALPEFNMPRAGFTSTDSRVPIIISFNLLLVEGFQMIMFKE